MADTDAPSPDPDDAASRRAADEARVAKAAEAWRARSRRVHWFRRVLPIVILVLGGAVLAWIVGRSVISGIQRDQEAQEVKLANPRFQGQDEQGRAFIIGAQQAVRDPATGHFRLDGPLVRLDLSPGQSSELSAGHGIYDEANKNLILRDRVRIADAQSDMTFVTPEAVVDTQTGVVTGDKGIEGSGRMGQISAQSFTISDQGRRVTFRGDGDNKVTSTLNLAETP